MHSVTGVVRHVRRALGAAGLACAAACAASPAQPPSGAPGTFTEIYAELFPAGTTAQCNYCHDRPPNDISNGKLNMGHTRADAYAALVGPSSASAKCGGGRSLVVPGDPSGSLLYQKLGTAPPCGDRMPQGGSPLTDAQLEMVRSWIAAGAKND